MSFFNLKKTEKVEKKDQDQIMDIKQIESDLSDFYNKTNRMHEFTLEAFEAFAELEEYIGNNSKTKEYKNLLKAFFEENGKCSFRLRVFLGEVEKIIKKLSLDEVSGLQIKKLCYHHLTNLILKREKTAKLNSSNINGIEVYRYGGDEFVIVVERDIGVEVVFIDLMYLNYFNEIGGHKGGDETINASARIIEGTVKEFKDKTTKTKDIIDKITSNFNSFKFDDSFSVLNKLFFHIDIGYANDGELKEIEEKFIKELEVNNIENRNKLTIEEKREILVELSDIRSDYQKKTSKIFFLMKLYRESENNNKLKTIFDGYAAFTKKMNIIKSIILKVLEFSDNEDEQFKKIAEETEKSVIKINKIMISEKIDKRERILHELVLSQAIKNLGKKKPEIDLNNIVTKWGID